LILSKVSSEGLLTTNLKFRVKKREECSESCKPMISGACGSNLKLNASEVTICMCSGGIWRWHFRNFEIHLKFLQWLQHVIEMRWITQRRMLLIKLVWTTPVPDWKNDRIWRNFLVWINHTIYQYCILCIGILSFVYCMTFSTFV